MATEDENFLFGLILIIGVFSLIQYVYLSNKKVHEVARVTTIFSSFLLFYGILSAYSCSDSAFCLSQNIDPRYGRFTYMGTALFISFLIFCLWKMIESFIAVVSVAITIALIGMLFNRHIAYGVITGIVIILVFVYIFLKDKIVDAFMHIVVSFGSSFNIVYAAIYMWSAAWHGVSSILDDIKTGQTCLSVVTCLVHVMIILGLFLLRIVAITIYLVVKSKTGDPDTTVTIAKPTTATTTKTTIPALQSQQQQQQKTITIPSSTKKKTSPSSSSSSSSAVQISGFKFPSYRIKVTRPELKKLLTSSKNKHITIK